MIERTSDSNASAQTNAQANQQPADTADITTPKPKRGRPRKTDGTSAARNSRTQSAQFPQLTPEQQELIQKIAQGKATLNDIPKRAHRGRPSKEEMLARQAVINAALAAQAESMQHHTAAVEAPAREKTSDASARQEQGMADDANNDETRSRRIRRPSFASRAEEHASKQAAAQTAFSDAATNPRIHRFSQPQRAEVQNDASHAHEHVQVQVQLHEQEVQNQQAEVQNTHTNLVNSASLFAPVTPELRRHRQHRSVGVLPNAAAGSVAGVAATQVQEGAVSQLRVQNQAGEPKPQLVPGAQQVQHQLYQPNAQHVQNLQHVQHAPANSQLVAQQNQQPVQAQVPAVQANLQPAAVSNQQSAQVAQPTQAARFVKVQRRRGRNKVEQATGPSLTREELQAMKVGDLRTKAQQLGIETAHVRKKELIEAVYQANAASEGYSEVCGVLDIQPEGYAFIRTGNYMNGDNDAFVHQQLIRQYALRPGDWIVGRVAPTRANNKFPPLNKIVTINNRDPEEIKQRPRFRDLTPIFPNERLVMENGKQSITGRAIDLVAPIGKGQRGLIVSPPKAGKTTILKRICQSITTNNPEVHLFCLLVDERPEEVTDMERSIKGTVVASTFDMPAENHTAVSELVIEHAKRLVELGEDVVVVLDSITRLARAYNIAQPASGRILSGGVDSAALYPPKKFLGAARNIEHGGSLTILASALIETGSKMDEVIFEEFKGTGNMELKLDRDLADRRIFPAIDPVSSGTRNEDLLIDKELQPLVWSLRRVLANMNSTERASSSLVKGLQETSDNKDFLVRFARRAQAIDYVDSPSKL